MKKILFITLFILAFVERVFFDLGPNTELVTLAMILGAAYIGRKESFWLTLTIMAATDLILGNTNIFIFTWTGFLIPALVSGTVFKAVNAEGIKKVGLGTVSGVGANLFFYFWTNFGVWLLGSMYPKTIAGLASSYINALPFLRMQFVSTIFFVPLGFSVMEVFFAFKKSPNFEKLIGRYKKLVVLGIR